MVIRQINYVNDVYIFKMIKKFFKEIVWEYFPVFIVVIVIGIMYMLEGL